MDKYIEKIKKVANNKLTTISKKKQILGYLEQQIRKQGFAGDTTIPLLTFLSAITRLFDEPVSLVVMGASGSGKSHSVDAGLQFIPDDQIIRLSGMSDHFLAYASDFDLSHKVLFLGEAAGMSEGNGRTFLRQLITEGVVRHSTVQKTADGMKGEMLPEVSGPVAFMMTTTAGKIHHEDQSRMLQLNVIESPERTKEVLLSKALGKSKTKAQIDLAPWHEHVRTIAEGDLSVSIPYLADIVEYLPLDNPKIQRDFSKVKALIEACALLHQFTRDRNCVGEIIATEEDYSTVFDLVDTALKEGLEEAVPFGVREVVECVSKLIATNPMQYDRGVSQSLVAENLGRNRSTVSRNAFNAVGRGYLENLTPGRGREAHLIMGGLSLPSGSVLPHPDVLFGRETSTSEEAAMAPATTMYMRPKESEVEETEYNLPEILDEKTEEEEENIKPW